MKKSLLFLLLFALLGGCIPLSLCCSAAETVSDGFTDVSQDDWFSDDVRFVSEAGLMIGKGNGVFDPDGWVTGAEAVTIAARVHAILTTGSPDAADHYQESADEPWHLTYTNYIYRYIGEFNVGSYDSPASRRDFARLLAAAVGDGAAEINEIVHNAVPDLEENALTAGIYRLYRAGILTGNDERGTFLPDANIRRSEAAAIAARILDPALRKRISLTEAAYRFDTTLTVPGGWFTLTVPDWWEGEVLTLPVKTVGEVFRMDFYCRLEVERLQYGGRIGSVGIRPHRENRNWPWLVMEIAMVTYPDGQTYDVTLHMPSDVQFTLGDSAEFDRASRSLRAVASAMQFPEGCEVIWSPDAVYEPTMERIQSLRQDLDRPFSYLSEWYGLTYSHASGGGSPVYADSKYGYLLAFSAKDANPDGTVRPDAKPQSWMVTKEGASVGDLIVGADAEEVGWVVPSWENVYFSTENGLYYTFVPVDDFLLTVGWKLPDEVWQAFLAELGDDADDAAYYTAFDKLIQPYRTAPVGSIAVIEIR
ncbi:MAG: S-layer homology domain-containing protein [Clostridia bacterium]|nr:S-layer homology domain-containing protein [Clostridia bacterium]